MSVPPLYRVDPDWSTALKPFQERDYPRALELALAYLADLDRNPERRARLLPFHYCNIHNNIAISAYHVLDGADDDRLRERREWRLFFASLDQYLQLSKKAAHEEPEETWWRDDRFLRTLMGSALRLLLRAGPERLAAETESWLRRCMAIGGAWGAQLALDVLLETLHGERINVLRPSYLENTQLLAQCYLRLTAALPAEPYRHPRSLVMDILSDLTYFTGGDQAENQALAWVEQALAINPDDRFALQRREDIRKRQLVMEQIRRFNHDTNTAIAGLVGNLARLQRLALPEHAPGLIEKMRLGLDRIHGVHRFVQGQQAKFVQLPLRQELERLVLAYEQAHVDIQGGEDGATLETDRHYLQIVVETLLRNAIEAFERNRIAPAERRIAIHFDPQSERIRVRDNAGGIAAQDRERIFEPYVSSKAVKETTGLGLAIARNIMRELLGGDIALSDPQPPDGAEFLLRFHCD